MPTPFRIAGGLSFDRAHLLVAVAGDLRQQRGGEQCRAQRRRKRRGFHRALPASPHCACALHRSRFPLLLQCHHPGPQISSSSRGLESVHHRRTRLVCAIFASARVGTETLTRRLRTLYFRRALPQSPPPVPVLLISGARKPIGQVAPSPPASRPRSSAAPAATAGATGKSALRNQLHRPLDRNPHLALRLDRPNCSCSAAVFARVQIGDLLVAVVGLQPRRGKLLRQLRPSCSASRGCWADCPASRTSTVFVHLLVGPSSLSMWALITLPMP